MLSKEYVYETHKSQEFLVATKVTIARFIKLLNFLTA